MTFARKLIVPLLLETALAANAGYALALSMPDGELARIPSSGDTAIRAEFNND